MVLSIDDILNGIEEYKEVFIDSLNDTIYLRPLSKGEWEKTNSIRQESLGDYVTNEKAKSLSRKQRVANIESQLSFNIKENSNAELKARTEAIFLSWNNDATENPPTREQIKKLRPNVFDEIYDKVREISGISEEEIDTLEDDVDDFPED